MERWGQGIPGSSWVSYPGRHSCDRQELYSLMQSQRWQPLPDMGLWIPHKHWPSNIFKDSQKYIHRQPHTYKDYKINEAKIIKKNSYINNLQIHVLLEQFTK